VNKIIPIALLILSIAGLTLAILAFVLVLLSPAAQLLGVAAVVLLILAIATNAFPFVGGAAFKGRLCKTALVVSSIAYALIFIGFVLLFAL